MRNLSTNSKGRRTPGMKSWPLGAMSLSLLFILLLPGSSWALRIRDRGLDSTSFTDPNNGGQYLRQRVVLVSTTPSPQDLLLNYYVQSQVTPKTVIHIVSSTPAPTIIITPSSSPVHPAPVYTSLVHDEEVEEEGQSGGKTEESDNYSEELSGEATTLRAVPRIPASLRRTYGREYSTTEAPYYEETEKPLRKKKKKIGTRRRKVKRPRAEGLQQQQQNEQVAEQPEEGKKEDLGTDAMPMKEGDKSLALELGSEDGKYALIDNFFNQTEVRRPGIVSYAQSGDFSRDNKKTLGNLKKSEIWLSEGQLLVLKGGNFDSTNRESWPPIDDYQRDKSRPPLKIPLDTNNPPPFPVFLNKTGPPVFLVEPPPFFPHPPPGFFGNDSNFDPSLFPPPGPPPTFPNGSLIPFPPPGGQYGEGHPPGGGNGQFPGGGPPFPFPPPNFNGSFPPNFGPPPPGFNPQNFNGSGPPPPGFPFLPPLVLNPADNETDDPSVFLPPPYDFDYYENNSTLVPAGPLAPGLVVPPPKDFYSVYNRTGRPPPRQPVPVPPPYFPPYEPEVTRPENVNPPKKQRPNGRKPNKYPNTYPSDGSPEEQYPQTPPTTQVPDPVYVTTKKRKQRPKKPFFPLETPGDYQNQGRDTNGDGSSEEVRPPTPGRRPPTVIFPDRPPVVTSPRPAFIENVYVTPTPRDRTTTYRITTVPTTTTTTSTTTTTTTPKSINNFVYVQGRLTTLEEIAAEEAAEEEFDPDRPTTPRPPFDSKGYPTRVVDENEPPFVFEFPKSTPKTKIRPKPTQAPLKTYYTGTPKYEPTYVPYQDTGRIRNSNVNNFSPSPTPTVVQNIPTHAPPTPSRPTILYQNPPYGQHHQQRRPQQHKYQAQGPQQIYYGPEQQNNGFYNLQNQGPSYITGGEQLQNPPTSQITFIPQRNPQNYNQDQNSQPNPTYSGFLPAFPPPQQAPTRPKSRQRLIFPSQAPQQQYIPQPQPTPYQQQSHRQQQQQLQQQRQQQQQQQQQHYREPKKLPHFAPNGYYSPITNYFQPASTYPSPTQSSQPFQPYFPQNQNINHPQQGNYKYASPLSIPNNNYGPDPSIPSYAYQGGPSQLQLFQQSQQPQQPQRFIPTREQQNYPTPGRPSFNSQLKQFVQPLYDDIAVNYREPLPQYNTESESGSSRSAAIRAGPRNAQDKLSPSSTPGTFYSFQRGGPGGFSYNIRL